MTPIPTPTTADNQIATPYSLFVDLDGKRYVCSLPAALNVVPGDWPPSHDGVELAERGDWLYLRAENIAGGTAKYVQDESNPAVWHRYSGLLSGEAPTPTPTPIVPAKPVLDFEEVDPRSIVPVWDAGGLIAAHASPYLFRHGPAAIGPGAMPTPEDFARARQYLDAAVEGVYEGTRRAFDQLREHIGAGRIVVNPRVASFTPADVQAAQDAQARAIYGRDYIGMDELPAVLREAGRAQWSPVVGISWAPDYGVAQWPAPPEPPRTMSGYRAEQDRRELRAAVVVAQEQLRHILTRAAVDKGERVGNYLDWLTDIQDALSMALEATRSQTTRDLAADYEAAVRATDVFEGARKIADGAVRAHAEHVAGQGAPTIRLPAGSLEPGDTLEVRITNTAPASSFGGNGAMIGGDP